VTSLRTVLLHYHFFKCAGTSLERALQTALPGRWRNIEAKSGLLSTDEMREFILNHPDVAAISSHTATYPPPEATGLIVIPIVLVRHPLARVQSVYDFEHRQTIATEGTRVAWETDIVGYVEWRLSRRHDYSIRNFQVHRLSPSGVPSIDSATATIASLPFVGVVEQYGASLRKLQELLNQHFPAISLPEVRANATRPPSTLNHQLGELRARIGSTLYQELVDANLADLELWTLASSRYGGT
jgi:hypothetical protein